MHPTMCFQSRLMLGISKSHLFIPQRLVIWPLFGLQPNSNQPLKWEATHCCQQYWTCTSSKGFVSHHRNYARLEYWQPVAAILAKNTNVRCFSEPGKNNAESSRENESDRSLAALAQEVIDATKRQDVMAATLQPQAVENLLQDLGQLDWPMLPTARLLSGRLWLLQQPQAVVSIAETMSQQGFIYTLTVDLLKNLPSEYVIKTHQLTEVPGLINESTLQLRDFGMSGEEVDELVGRSPQVLLTKTKTLRSVFMKLKGLFTAVDALRVAVTCPTVFYQTWEETNMVFDYAFFTMGYSQAQIVRSQALACPLVKLQDRHVYLTRAGFFVKVRPKDDPRLNPNPSLRLVVKIPDARFAEEFGGLSEEEYQTFLAMRELEREAEEELGMSDEDSSDSSDSSDSDSDSGDRKRDLSKKSRR